MVKEARQSSLLPLVISVKPIISLLGVVARIRSLEGLLMSVSIAEGLYEVVRYVFRSSGETVWPKVWVQTWVPSSDIAFASASAALRMLMGCIPEMAMVCDVFKEDAGCCVSNPEMR